MRHTYRFHPSEYELGENEKFYGGMEAKGWRLVKRGTWLSKFEAAEPNEARYRIEVSAPGFLEESGLSEGQLAVFADCGWELAADYGLLHIFRAPAGSSAPEFYTDPAQQAETLKKLKRRALWGWVPVTLFWIVYWLPGAAIRGGAAVSGEFQRRLVELPSLFLLGAFLLLDGLYHGVRDAWLITRTYRRMKRGVPLDHSPQRRRLAHRITCWFLTALTVLSAALFAWQLLRTRSGDLPIVPDGPYLAAGDLGLEGERSEFMGQDSGITYSPSLLADYWDVRECVKSAETTVILYQDVYRLRDARMREWLAGVLRKNALFGDGGRNFKPVETRAVDAAWVNDMGEVVAVKGLYAAYVLPSGWGFEKPGAPAICEALAARWDALPGTGAENF